MGRIWLEMGAGRELEGLGVAVVGTGGRLERVVFFGLSGIRLGRSGEMIGSNARFIARLFMFFFCFKKNMKQIKKEKTKNSPSSSIIIIRIKFVRIAFGFSFQIYIHFQLEILFIF